MELESPFRTGLLPFGGQISWNESKLGWPQNGSAALKRF